MMRGRAYGRGRSAGVCAGARAPRVSINFVSLALPLAIAASSSGSAAYAHAYGAIALPLVPWLALPLVPALLPMLAALQLPADAARPVVVDPQTAAGPRPPTVAVAGTTKGLAAHTAVHRTPLYVNATRGRDSPSCGVAESAPCQSITGALAVARARSLRAVSLRCARGQYPIAAPLAMPAGMDVQITLPDPPSGQHRSSLSCGAQLGVTTPCVTVGEGAVLELSYLMVEAMMVGVGAGGRLSTRACKFETQRCPATCGHVALLQAPPPTTARGAAAAATPAMPFINMTDTDPSSRPTLNSPVALVAAEPVVARIMLGMGERPSSPPRLPLNASADVFKGYPAQLMGHDCYQPQFRTAAAPSDRKMLVVAADGSGDFRTVQAAVNAIPEGGRPRDLKRLKVLSIR